MEILYACVRTTSITTLDLALCVGSYNFGQILSLLALCIDLTFETKHRRNQDAIFDSLWGCLRLVAVTIFFLLRFSFKRKSFIFYCDDWKEENQLVDPENATPALSQPSYPQPFYPFNPLKIWKRKVQKKKKKILYTLLISQNLISRKLFFFSN